MRRSNRRWMVAGWLGVCALGACGDDHDDPSGTSSSTTAFDTTTSGATDPGTTSSSEDSGACPSYGIGAYGDCLNFDRAECERLDASCLLDDLAAPTLGVCSAPCSTTCDCPAPRSGTAVAACVPDDAGGGACILDCSSGRACPLGMICVGGQCTYPRAETTAEPYGACLEPEAACHHSGCVMLGVPESDVAYAACFAECSTAIECPVPPAGTAVGCDQFQLSTGRAVSLCYLDCSQTSCPEGMTCLGDRVCVWPTPAEDDAGTSEDTGGGSESGSGSGSGSGTDTE